MLKRNGILLALALLAACAERETGERGQAAPAPPEASAGQPDVAMPAASAAPPLTAPLAQIEPGVYRNGAFAVRVERAVIRGDQSGLDATLSLSVHNTGRAPVSFVALDPNATMSMVLDTGDTLRPDYSFSQSACNLPPDRCRAEHPAIYTQVDPGAFAVVNVGLSRRTATKAEAVRTGNLAARIHLLDGAGGERIVPLSLMNVPLQAQ